MEKITQKVLKRVDLKPFRIDKTPKEAWVLDFNSKSVMLAPWMVNSLGRIRPTYVKRFQEKLKSKNVCWEDIFPKEARDWDWMSCGLKLSRDEKCPHCGDTYLED